MSSALRDARRGGGNWPVRHASRAFEDFASSAGPFRFRRDRTCKRTGANGCCCRDRHGPHDGPLETRRGRARHSDRRRVPGRTCARQRMGRNVRTKYAAFPVRPCKLGRARTHWPRAFERPSTPTPTQSWFPLMAGPHTTACVDTPGWGPNELRAFLTASMNPCTRNLQQET